MSLVLLNIESHYLQTNTNISIILPNKPWNQSPSDFYSNGKKYKALWLLHGSFGDNTDWLRKSNIDLYACEKDLVVIMPSALNSNYINWPEFGMGYNMWDFFTEELMPLVYNWFPVSDKREDNFIGGLSMGGIGTIQYAVNHPNRFGAAAILSWAPFDFNTMKTETDPKKREFHRIMIQNSGGFETLTNSVENVWDALPDFEKLEQKPRLYFAIGKNDFLFKQYCTFKEYAQRIGLSATFEEYECFAHEWRFWDLAIQKALDFFSITS